MGLYAGLLDAHLGGDLAKAKPGSAILYGFPLTGGECDGGEDLIQRHARAIVMFSRYGIGMGYLPVDDL